MGNNEGYKRVPLDNRGLPQFGRSPEAVAQQKADEAIRLARDNAAFQRAKDAHGGLPSGTSEEPTVVAKIHEATGYHLTRRQLTGISAFLGGLITIGGSLALGSELYDRHHNSQELQTALNNALNAYDRVENADKYPGQPIPPYFPRVTVRVPERGEVDEPVKLRVAPRQWFKESKDQVPYFTLKTGSVIRQAVMVEGIEPERNKNDRDISANWLAFPIGGVIGELRDEKGKPIIAFNPDQIFYIHAPLVNGEVARK